MKLWDFTNAVHPTIPFAVVSIRCIDLCLTRHWAGTQLIKQFLPPTETLCNSVFIVSANLQTYLDIRRSSHARYRRCILLISICHLVQTDSLLYTCKSPLLRIGLHVAIHQRWLVVEDVDMQRLHRMKTSLIRGTLFDWVNINSDGQSGNHYQRCNIVTITINKREMDWTSFTSEVKSFCVVISLLICLWLRACESKSRWSRSLIEPRINGVVAETKGYIAFSFLQLPDTKVMPIHGI